MMPPTRRKRIFICHPYSKENFHDNLVHLLSRNDRLPYYNHSVPKDNKIEGTKRQIRTKVEQKIRTSSAVVVVASNHASHRPFIEKEIKIVKKYNKPIIAVKPRGQQKISKVVSENATAIVGWRKKSIQTALRKKKGK
jgi:hypothetical protein